MNTQRTRKAILSASLAFILFTLGTLILHAEPPAQTQPSSQKDITFATAGNTPLKLDIATPANGEGPFPTVIFLFGGGWRAGNKRDMTHFINGISQMGYVGIAPQYRLVPKAHFPAQIYDCKAAVRWARANAKQYKIDPDRICVVGFSAGGHLACLLGTTTPADGLDGIPAPGSPADLDALTNANPEQSSQVQAVVSFFGPTDFTTRDWAKNLEDPVINPFLGGSFADKPDVYKKASPITYASKNTPPILLIHGTKDELVPVDQSIRLAKKLNDLGAAAELIILEDEKHGFSNANNQKTMKQMMDFINAKFKK